MKLKLLFIMSFCFSGYSQEKNDDLKFIKSEVYNSLDKAEIAKLSNYDKNKILSENEKVNWIKLNNY